jgi:hypothetical protein
MNDYLRSGSTDFPLVHNAQGGPSADGRALLVEGATANGEFVRFAVSLNDVQHFVAFLLVSVGKISAVQRHEGKPDAEQGNPCRPIPATSIAVGAPEDGEGYLGISVGCSELMFAVPISAFEPVARSMLLASAQPTDKGLT